MRYRLPLLILVLLLGGSPAVRSQQPASAAFVVIVHPENPLRALSRSFVADAFLKRTARWSDGRAIEPVDLSSHSAVRRRFSEEVLRRSLGAVRSYWQQVIFTGRGVPPVEFDDEAAVVRYVQSRRGAIGYISASTSPGRARVVSLR